MMREFSREQDNSFFLALNSQIMSEETPDSIALAQMLREVNSHRFYYYFCYNVREYVLQKKDSKGSALLYIALPKYVCIKTYLPNIRLYEEILREIEGKCKE